MAKQKITVPDIGGAEGAEVIELLVAEGDVVQLDQGLIVLESDKASMEIPAPLSGEISSLTVRVGDMVKQGDPVGSITGGAAEAAAAPAPAATPEPTPESTPTPTPGPTTSPTPPILASHLTGFNCE